MIDALRERFPAEEARALAVDNAATFYLAGHETTANALTWTLFLLAAQPELQEELAGEAQAALGTVSEDGRSTDRLPRLRLFLMESLRLYPPVPRFDRREKMLNVQAITFGGLMVADCFDLRSSAVLVRGAALVWNVTLTNLMWSLLYQACAPVTTL